MLEAEPEDEEGVSIRQCYEMMADAMLEAATELSTEIIVCKCQWIDYYDYRLMYADGTGHARVSLYPDEVIISDLFVVTEERRKGKATKLLDKIDELVAGREISITPLEAWEATWYQSRGYVIEAEY